MITKLNSIVTNVTTNYTVSQIECLYILLWPQKSEAIVTSCDTNEHFYLITFLLIDVRRIEILDFQMHT